MSLTQQPVRTVPLASPGGSCRRRRLMRAGEQLRFAEHAKLSVSAPRPSSGSLRSPPVPTLFVPSGHFPLIGGIGPEGKAKGACCPAPASRIRRYVPTSSLFTIPSYLTKRTPQWGVLFIILPYRVTCRKRWSIAATWARWARACGARRLPLTPFRMPFCTHHSTASCAHALT